MYLAIIWSSSPPPPPAMMPWRLQGFCFTCVTFSASARLLYFQFKAFSSTLLSKCNLFVRSQSWKSTSPLSHAKAWSEWKVRMWLIVAVGLSAFLPSQLSPIWLRIQRWSLTRILLFLKQLFLHKHCPKQCIIHHIHALIAILNYRTGQVGRCKNNI